MLLHMWKKEENRVFCLITCAVLTAHGIFLFFLSLQPTHAPTKVFNRSVVVKTIALQPVKMAEEAKTNSAKEAPVKTKAPATASKANPIKKDPPKAAAKQAAEKKAALPEENIRKIQENLSKINTKSLEKMPVAELPNALAALQVDSVQESGEGSLGETHYRDELSRRLRMFLKLPEAGEVIIKLTLNRAGAVVRIGVEKAGGEANRKYVEKALPGLLFPPFGTYFGGQDMHTFTIALRSESML